MIAFNDMSPLLANALQTSLAVTALILVVLLVRKPFARHFGAKAAYALWLVPLARLFMPPLPANASLFGIFAPTQEAAAPQVPPMEFVIARSADTATVAAPAAPMPVHPVEWTPSEVVEPGLLDGVLATLPSMMLPVWMIGAVLVLGLAWRRQAVFHQLIRDDSSPASDAVHEATHEIAAQLKVRRGFEVRTSLLNGSPLVTGFLKPVILLPEWFEADYSPREQRDALTHELMHIKRGDLFALQAAQIMLAVQWFNPLAHVAIRAFRVDQEAACDADVLRAGTSSAFSYGRTLVKAARLAGPADTAFSGANLTLAHPIKERLILMQNAAPTFRRRLLGSTLAVTLGTAAIFATASCAASASPKDQSSAELAGGDETEVVEKKERHTKVYRFSSHGEGDDHQFVLLSDPFEKLKPRLDKLHKLDLSDLEEEMRVLSIEMSDIGKMDLSSLKELEKLGELGELEGLAELGNMSFDFDLQFDGMDIETIETEDGVKIIIPDQEIFISKLDEGAFEIQIEKIAAMAEAQAERAAVIAEAHADRAEKMALVIETRMEEKGARMEELGDQIEARVEAAFEGGLEDDLEAAGEVVEDLAEQCEDLETGETSPIVVSTRGDDGETYRALCVSGERSRLQDDDVKQFVANHPSLSKSEKERFATERSHSYEFSWTHD
ncbi:M56 family metallopeptidase [Henriciella sp.]|uniref:M56 family metallopeptidase n=1 Tax=Henriciella sp. TaxID=1968823 RepID=UPI00260AA8FB|nr:M56 family metallopeptidase [Henriciella sp.]